MQAGSSSNSICNLSFVLRGLDKNVDIAWRLETSLFRCTVLDLDLVVSVVGVTSNLDEEFNVEDEL